LTCTEPWNLTMYVVQQQPKSRPGVWHGAALPAALALCLFLAAWLWDTASFRGAGSGEIPFRKHTIDLGRSESVAVADINQDGRLDIVSGENWYEQTPPVEKGAGPRWIKHHFRDLPYTDGYIEDLSDLAIDVNGDGYPDIVSCSYWEGKPRGRGQALAQDRYSNGVSGGVCLPGRSAEYGKGKATPTPVWRRAFPIVLVRDHGQRR
jgi:hypothetical protein